MALLEITKIPILSIHRQRSLSLSSFFHLFTLSVQLNSKYTRMKFHSNCNCPATWHCSIGQILDDTTCWILGYLQLEYSNHTEYSKSGPFSLWVGYKKGENDMAVSLLSWPCVAVMFF